MASAFFEQLLFKFRKHNTLMRLLLLNVIVFGTINLINVFYKIGVDLNASTPIDIYIIKNIVLPSSLSSFVLQPWSIITYMFWHVSLGHIFMNMLMFYIFGSLFQEYLGNKRLVSVYFWGGISGGLLFVALFNLLPGLRPMASNAVLAGASASVMAILVASATLLPKYEMNLFGIFYIRLPFIAIFFALVSLLSMAGNNAGGEIAHVGGALFGFLYIKAIYSNFTWWTNLKKKLKPSPSKNKKNPNLKIYEPSKTYIKPSLHRKPSQEEIDIILDKISASGYESLNQAEKDILFKASHQEE